MTVLLSVQGLTKAFGPRPLFTDLSLDLRAGERVGLIGPNGSGKTTLLRLLAGLEEPDAGTRALRRGGRLGYLPQDDVFPPSLTVAEVVRGGLADQPLEDHERDVRAAAPSPRSASPPPGSRPTRCRAAGASGWRWRGSWHAGPTCCFWTSRPTTSTCRASPGWGACCVAPRSP